MPQLMRLLVYEYDTKSVEDVQVVKSASDNDLQIGIYTDIVFYLFVLFKGECFIILYI